MAIAVPAATSFLPGRLTWDAIPTEPIMLANLVVVAVGGASVFAALTRFKLWGYLWHEWLTSVNHKKIGVLGLIMLARGFADAILMRLQQVMAFGGSEGYRSAHGVIMIFFVAMPFVTGLMNFVVALQIGARDVWFPYLNNFSFWMTVGGAVIVMAPLFLGEFAQTGGLAFPPLSGIAYSPCVGVNCYIWGLQVAGVGTTLSGINLMVTIIKIRAPAMTLMRMPIFVWTALCTNILSVATFPVLTMTLILLRLDRYVGTSFFTNDLSGNPMMSVNLI